MHDRKRTEVRAVGDHRSGKKKFIDVFCLFQRIFRSFGFLHVVQKQTQGEVETRMVVWWPIVSGIPVPKTIKIWLSFFELQLIMSGMFF